MTYYGNMRRISNTGRNIAGDKLTLQLILLKNCTRKKTTCSNNNTKQQRSFSCFKNSKRAPRPIFGIYMRKQ